MLCLLEVTATKQEREREREREMVPHDNRNIFFILNCDVAKESMTTSAPHLLHTASTPGPGFPSSKMGPGGKASYTPTRHSAFDVVVKYHPNMP